MRLALLALAPLLAGGCQTTGDEDVAPYEETAATRTCGTHEPSEGAKLTTEAEVTRIPRREAVEGGTIDVHVHVIAKGPTRADGNLPDAVIVQQLGVLDRAFAAGGWTFRLASIERHARADWFTLRAGSREELTIKSHLRRGTGPRVLNLYTADPGNGFIGYATYPTHYKSSPHTDGVVIHPAALPGGDEPYAQGDQLVHQVGHWMGLYHTYAADCSTDRGDFVDDTPPTSSPAFGCPVGRDTCGADGDDPVRNYMDSTDDLCMNAFTRGQTNRMQVQFDAFRRFD